MGPCELMDLIGHDTNFAVTRSVLHQVVDPLDRQLRNRTVHHQPQHGVSGVVGALRRLDELAEVLAEPTKHLMVFRPSMVEFDFNGQLPSRCRCLYGYWKGYLKNQDWVDLQKSIARGNGDFIPAHVSGHAYVVGG